MPSDKTQSTTLHLALKKEYFDAVRDGSKTHEYRLISPHWVKRLVCRKYDSIVLTLGYPARGDHSRRLVRPWRGYTTQTITHPHFGPRPVHVFAIEVRE